MSSKMMEMSRDQEISFPDVKTLSFKDLICHVIRNFSTVPDEYIYIVKKSFFRALCEKIGIQPPEHEEFPTNTKLQYSMFFQDRSFNILLIDPIYFFNSSNQSGKYFVVS